MMNHRSPVVPDDDGVTYLGTAPSPARYRPDWPPSYSSSPNPKPTTTPMMNSSPIQATTFRSSSPSSTPPIYRTNSRSSLGSRGSPKAVESTTFRNITAETENFATTATPRQGFLPLSSPAAPLSGGPGDEKLVTRLYGQIETQEAEFNKLQYKYEEEKKRREQMAIELAEAREEIEENKKRINNYKKQEKEHRNRYALDLKERNREDESRWEATIEEIKQLRQEVEVKTQKLAEFEFLCLNLQQSLAHEKEKGKADVADIEKRVALSSKMLETCHAQLSRADKQLKKERKMKQILIKINEALQHEIKRLHEHVARIKEETELQITTSLSMQQSKETVDRTHEIMQDLQIEDALFYFEEVKRQYEDRPKVYRVFLEVIRDYKSRALSTPEVIARISKLFQGKSKLIIGFNRFLPDDYHISEEDVADMQLYNVQSTPAPVKTKSPAVARPPPISIATPSTAVGGSTPSTAMRSSRSKAKASSTKEGGKKNKSRTPQKTPASSTKSSKVELKVAAAFKKEMTGKTPKSKSNENDIQLNYSEDSDLSCSSTSNSSSEKNQKKSSSSSRGKTPSSKKSKAAKEDKSPRIKKSHSSLSKHSVSSNRSGGLTINTSSTVDEECAAKPPVKKPPPDLVDDDDDDFDDDMSSTSFLETEILTDLASPAIAEIGSPGKFEKFSSFNLSTVASSNLFGGIESIDDSFGVGIMSVDNTTHGTSSRDRYDVGDDEEYGAIEILADHHTSTSSYSLNKRSSSGSSTLNKRSSSSDSSTLNKRSSSDSSTLNKRSSDSSYWNKL